MRLSLLLPLLALAACQPQAPAVPEPAPAQAAPEPGPAPPPVRFTPLSPNAATLTGAIALSPMPRSSPEAPPEMRLQTETGLIYTTELLVGGAEQATAIDWKSVFGADVVVAANPPRGAPSVDLHIIAGETVPDAASAGGFCGDDPTYALAMATGLVVDGKDQVALAAFKGSQWPPANASALCGTFSYAPPPRQPPPN